MTRYPYAARQLEREVKHLFSKSEMDPQDEGDGFGVYRRFRFDKETSDEIQAAVEQIASDDERFSAENTAHGLVVEFVGDRRADDARPFGVTEIRAALREVEQPVEEPPPSKKKAAAKPK